MIITKTRFGTLYQEWEKVVVHFPNLKKNFTYFFIVVFSFSTTLGMILRICIFYHLPSIKSLSDRQKLLKYLIIIAPMHRP